MIISHPHALYVNGELVGIITNPDPFPGGLSAVLDALNDAHLHGVTDAVTIPTEGQFYELGDLRLVLQRLGVKSEVTPSSCQDD